MTKKAKNPRRILVVDDVAEWRVRLRSLLQERADWQVIGEACEGLQAVQMTSELRPDIVVMDVGMPTMNGIEAAKRIRQTFPDSMVIFVTQDGDADIRAAALAIGAKGYVAKANASSELLLALDAALGNG